ncbi:N,N-dimethylformamidase beta subunit family domain-containing protein [Streptomyces sp. PT12]|uniref:N,N-dimethylformamidase beta subunit family domain-containing protein n=1 Tax=Streptomyces sp. PT12 TaxID=1510197 RepID=UPI000DE49CB8|nr:N,N-dimethylformamidase beta subunit family domain-containing protein [Streptomyces sp. PT12]RBM14905.1 phosphoribosylamine--glycine ligase [Streptomyces sp. PT12]
MCWDRHCPSVRRREGSLNKSTEHIRRWEAGALTHAVSDPFGQGPVPWVRAGDGHLRGADQVLLPGRDPGAPTTLRAADDVGCQIKGFVTEAVVAPGQPLDFRVTVDPPREFTIDIYRIGYFGDEGARLLLSSPKLMGIRQPPPLAAGRTVSCHHWWLSWRLQVPTDWLPGAYVAVLTTADGAFRSHVPFAVRDDRPADLLLVLPDVTWQAYNLFPEDGSGGASLYHAWDGAGRLLGEQDAAITVSFDRPYAGSGLPLHAGHAYDFIRWAERFGYDVGYATARDLHAGRVDPGRYRALVFSGHDEYWSAPMRRAVEEARDGGTSLVFLSANTMYWQVTLAALPSGDEDRLLSCRKRQGPGRAPLWRELGRPEQQVLGIQYTGAVPHPHPLVVRNADHWLWESTGAQEGDELPGLVAGEADRYFPRTALPECTSRILLAHSPYRDASGARRHQETSLYRAPSGAWVFASGTFAWTPALSRPGHVDPRVQKATANLMDRICKRD